MSTKSILDNIANWRAHLTMDMMSFLITSSIVYGFCVAIIKSNNDNIDNWALIGIICTITCATTFASNVIMTHDAGGNDLLCVCEVVLGNLLGAFITPALIQMYTSNSLFAFGDPSSGGSISALYGRVMKQVGLSVFVPLFVGQCIQNIFPKPTSAYIGFLKKYNIKIGSYMLLLIMFSSFSTAFYQKSFTSVSHVCIIFVCFFNLEVYLFFTGVSFLVARPIWIIKLFPEEPVKGECSRLYYYSYKLFRPFYYSKRDTICIIFCAPAKTAALGVSLLTSQYGTHKEHLGKLLVPLVLYQAEQVLTASIFVPILKKWASDEIEQEKFNAGTEDIATKGDESDLEKYPSTESDETEGQSFSTEEQSTV